MLLAGCTAESSVDDELLEDISETPDTNEESDPGSAPEEIIEEQDNAEKFFKDFVNKNN